MQIMKCKISPEFIFVVIIFLLIVFVSTYGSIHYIPYTEVSTKLNGYPYSENYENIDLDLNDNENNKKDKIPSEKTSTIDSSVSVSVSPFESVLKSKLNSSPVTNTLSSMPKKTTEGLTTLQGSTYGKNNSIDVISSLPSSPDCVGISSGLSNSTGGICISPEIKKLIQTRGLNSSKQDSQIGA
jgi:hypothetical protein